MTDFIDISQIDVLEKEGHAPLYVMIAGGMGAGKSYVVDRNIHTVKLFDIDEVMVRRGYSEYTSEQFKSAMDEIVIDIDSRMEDRLSMIAMGTASNTTLAIDRLHTAKAIGYATVLVHIDAPVSQALEQNRLRIEKGERGVSKANEHKIERTSVGAASTVAILRESVLVDYFVFYNNTRKELINE